MFGLTEHAVDHDVLGEGLYTGQVLRETKIPHGSNGVMHYYDDFDAEIHRYEGDWQYGNWHGTGVLHFKNGDSYLGSFENATRHGTGMYVWTDGRMYEGGFCQNMRHGKGTFTWPYGATYSGDFHQGRRQGKGKYNFADGNIYEGSWKQGEYDGYGYVLLCYYTMLWNKELV
jgi:hypothetical protein